MRCVLGSPGAGGSFNFLPVCAATTAVAGRAAVSYCTYLSSCVIDVRDNLLLSLEATMGDRAREAKTDDDEEEAPIISPREVSTTTAQHTKKNLRDCGLTSRRYGLVVEAPGNHDERFRLAGGCQCLANLARGDSPVTAGSRRPWATSIYDVRTIVPTLRCSVVSYTRLLIQHCSMNIDTTININNINSRTNQSNSQLTYFMIL